MSRNVFENNIDPEVLNEIEELSSTFGGHKFTLLPELEPGEYYELVTLSSGRVAVVAKKG